MLADLSFINSLTRALDTFKANLVDKTRSEQSKSFEEQTLSAVLSMPREQIRRNFFDPLPYSKLPDVRMPSNLEHLPVVRMPPDLEHLPAVRVPSDLDSQAEGQALIDDTGITIDLKASLIGLEGALIAAVAIFPSTREGYIPYIKEGIISDELIKAFNNLSSFSKSTISKEMSSPAEGPVQDQ
jgi:hypothetical protein